MAKSSLIATQTTLTEIDPSLQPQVALTPSILLDPAKPDLDLPSTVSRVGSGNTLLGRFTLLEMIGEGAISRVFKALDLRKVEAGAADPHVAIKIFTLPFANYSDAMTVLSPAVHSLQSLIHPNIGRVFDCDRDGETVFMIMELLCGQSLLDKMRAAASEGGLSRDISRRLIKGIADALEFAHRNNILHGNLKPGNVFITNGGEVKVIDFGLARFRAPAATPTSATSEFDYTPALPATYASPEMLENQAPDPRDDIYALASVAWKLMTGDIPSPNVEQLACPRQLNGREFQALCRALQFERDKRTASVRQFQDEFNGAGRRISRLAAVCIGASIAVVLGATTFFSLRSVHEKTSAPSAPAPVASAPLAPSSGAAFRDCPECPLMKVLPAGDFQQGSAADAAALASEMPRHKVSIAYAFAAGVYDVTVAEYSQFVSATGVAAHSCATYSGAWRVKATVTWKNAIESQTSSHPVSCVSWQDAKDYAAWLSHTTNHTYRLPSASEWEYLARAGSSAQVPWTAPTDACTYANIADQTAARRYEGWKALPCSDEFVESAPVGSFKENAFGLYDTLGNVFQWTEDCWTDNYQGAPTNGAAQTSGDCTQHELRGGSWFTQPEFVRAAYRNRFDGNYRSTSVGFRLVRELSK